jgi:dTDP-glucose 4,6-dehydratase
MEQDPGTTQRIQPKAARSPMKTLIATGAAGFIGSNFVRLALKAGYRVIGLDALTYAGHRESLAGIDGPFELVVGDIREPAIQELLQKYHPAAIVNFAAESHVDRSIEKPLVFVETNVLGTANLLHQSLKYWESHNRPANFRYLQVSTDEVYGSLGDKGKFSEHTPVDPSSPYSASKTGGDHLVKAWHHTYGLPTLTTRCSNNYGPYQFPEKLIPYMIQCALSGKPLPVYGDGHNVRDWIYVEDHCQGILLALEKAAPGSTYCLGGRSEMKNIDLVRMLCEILDERRPKQDGSYKDQITFVKNRLGHDLRYAIDDSKAEKDLAFTRTHSFASGLQSTVEWYLANENWVKNVMNRGKQ